MREQKKKTIKKKKKKHVEIDFKDRLGQQIVC